MFAGNAPKKSGDENYPFTPNRNFYYFTGIDEEGPILIISKIKGIISERLFIKEIDEEKIIESLCKEPIDYSKMCVSKLIINILYGEMYFRSITLRGFSRLFPNTVSVGM